MKSSLAVNPMSGSLERIVRLGILTILCVVAFAIRMFSVARYESVVHEFDPYFNFRTTKFLAHYGSEAFLNWFDDSAWYPLGRIVGYTIYPGLMFTAAILHKALHFLNIGIDMRNVCVLIAPTFAALTVMATYYLGKICYNRKAGLFAAAFMAIIPGYISRSVAGAYDNESIAIFAIVCTFACWVAAVRDGSPYKATLVGLSYFYMVSAWGGYVFVLNLIAIHTLVTLIIGQFSVQHYTAYNYFYVTGTALSMLITFIGRQPLQSSEHLPALGVFGLIQLWAFFSWAASKLTPNQYRIFLRYTVVLSLGLAAVGFVIASALGIITPWTGRLYALLDPTYAKEHIPIIASVSEHQPTAWGSFFFDLNITLVLVPVGLYYCFKRMTQGAIFIIVYLLVSVYFAGVMVRLILVLSPVAAVCGGIGISGLLRSFSRFSIDFGNDRLAKAFSTGVMGLLFALCAFYTYHCTWAASTMYSSPQVVISATRGDGSSMIFDDFRDSYRWLAHNTKQDARIMSWWDYGYQLAAMANRTVLVDNNTWNNTHIAQVGRAFASDEDEAYKTLVELDVDYVLIFFGGSVGFSSDDINKFIWMIRIGGTLDKTLEETEYFSERGEYTIGKNAGKRMLDSLLYSLSYYRFGELYTAQNRPPGFDRVRQEEIGRKDIKLKHLEEAFTSEHWLVRIYRVKKPENTLWHS